jgi:hypothetical protein
MDDLILKTEILRDVIAKSLLDSYRGDVATLRTALLFHFVLYLGAQYLCSPVGHLSSPLDISRLFVSSYDYPLVPCIILCSNKSNCQS